MAAAVPFALKAGVPLLTGWLGRKASGPSGQQQSAMQQTQQAGAQLGKQAGPLVGQGTALAGQGAGYLGNAANYYQNILGSRTAARESLAPEMTTALDFYRGAENKAARTMRGGARDYALAELDRQKVGQLAGFLPAARRGAAADLGSLGSAAISGGSALTGQGMQGYANQAYIGSGLFNQASQLRDQEREGGKTWGSLLYDVAQALPWGKQGQRVNTPNLFMGF